MEARIISFSDGYIEIESPYNNDFVTALKKSIPYYDVSWDHIKKRWVTIPKYYKIVKALLHEYYEDVSEVLA